jgi:hypothetical protein
VENAALQTGTIAVEAESWYCAVVVRMCAGISIGNVAKQDNESVPKDQVDNELSPK